MTISKEETLNEGGSFMFYNITPRLASILRTKNSFLRSRPNTFRDIRIRRNHEYGILSVWGWIDMRPTIPMIFASIQNRLKKAGIDRKSTRLNSSHVAISYAVF